MDFEVRHIDGTTVKLISSEHVSAITSATQTRKLCGNDTVTINLQSATYIEFRVGDTIKIFGTTYTMNQLPTVKKESERSYTYTLVFEGLQYTLIDRVFLMPANTQGDNLMFDLAGMLRELQTNINRGVLDENNNPINSAKPYEFVLDESLEETEYKNLSLTGKNCLQVLQQLCQEWDTEFVFAEEPTRIAIYIGVAGSTFPTTFKYGRGGGVYELNREKGASDICTRLFVYGGTQNLTYYRHNRLCLPSKEKNQSYVEDATAQAVYGIKEQVKNFDDIYPNRIGTITSLSGCDYNEFIDSAMADSQFGFDLNEKWANNEDDCEEWLALKGLEDTPENEAIYYNDVANTATKYLMAGATAKIHFNTGALAGYECDLHSYTHSNQKFVLKPLVDENGYDFPSKTNAAFKLAVGDEYVILDINLPTAYKTQAESKLATEAASYFDTVCRPQPKYTLTIEPIALKHIVGPSTADTEIFKVGDLINISDPTGGVESATIRIDQFVRNLLDPFDYKLTLTDEITYSQQVRTLIEVDAIKRVVEESKIYDVNRIRRGWKDAEELYNQMFDTEGHYYSEKIAPLSIDTQMLKVGARSQQLVLQNVLFQPNYNADPANLEISAGSLVHYTIAEPDIKTWTMSALSDSNVPSTAQYVYAKCAKNGTTGTWLVTDQAIIFDSDPSYYHFLVGSLSSVDSVSNTRNFAATYGFTTINGRNITTGVIKSADGSGVIIDLDNGTIKGNIVFESGGAEKRIDEYIADEVGDEISGLGIDGTNLLPITNFWEQGTTNNESNPSYTYADMKSASSTRIRTKSNINLEAGEKYTLHCGSGFECGYVKLNNGYGAGWVGWSSTPLTFTVSGFNSIAVLVKKVSDANITPDEIGNAKVKLERGETATAWTLAPEDVKSAMDAVDNLEIGGRNLIKGTSKTNVYSYTLSAGSSYADLYSKTINRVLGEKNYVLSLEVKGSAPFTMISHWYNPNTTTKAETSSGYTGASSDGYCTNSVTTEWKRFWVKWQQSDDADTTKNLIPCRVYQPSSGTLTVYIRAVKFEVGTVPTDYSPAPEDTDYLRNALNEATSGSTEIIGGLILTKMIQAGSNDHQSGMAGLESSDVAFWAGGSLSGAAAMSTPLVIMRNGLAKFGNLRLNPNGLLYMADSYDISRLLITRTSVNNYITNGDITKYPSNATQTGSEYGTIPNSSATVTTTNTAALMTVIGSIESISKAHSGMRVHYKGTITISRNTSNAVAFSVYLQCGNEIGNIISEATSSQTSWTINIDTYTTFDWNSNTNGTIGLYVKATTLTSSTTFTISGLQVRWYDDISNAKTVLGSDGFACVVNTSNLFKAIETTSSSGKILTTTIKGNVDMPGVLWAGRIASGGGVSSTDYNCVGKSVTSQRTATGTYKLTLSGFSASPTVLATIVNTVTSSPKGCSANVQSFSSSQVVIRTFSDNTLTDFEIHVVLFGKN